MLDQLRRETFEPLVGTVFTLALGGSELALVLKRTSNAGSARAQGRTPFALHFAGPERPILPQRIYPLQHAQMGALEIFLVPLGPEGGSMTYEAIFG